MDRLVACAICLIPMSEHAARPQALFIDGDMVDDRFGLDERITLIHEALADGRSVDLDNDAVASAHVTYQGVPMCLDHFAQAYEP
jgi:hypothetical protein